MKRQICFRVGNWGDHSKGEEFDTSRACIPGQLPNDLDALSHSILSAAVGDVKQGLFSEGRKRAVACAEPVLEAELGHLVCPGEAIMAASSPSHGWQERFCFCAPKAGVL